MAFLVDNDLDVSPTNLLLAHGAFSGSNPHLARQISMRSQSPEGVSQRWLDELAEQDSGQPDRADLDRLITRLENQPPDPFTPTPGKRAASPATMVRNSNSMSSISNSFQKTGRIVSSLANLAKVMLDRTRKAEDDMRKSEDEAKALRRSLARAKRDAEVDFLTGLPNRRAFEVLLDRHFRRPALHASRSASPFATSTNSRRSTISMATRPAIASSRQSPIRWRGFRTIIVMSRAMAARNSSCFSAA